MDSLDKKCVGLTEQTTLSGRSPLRTLIEVRDSGDKFDQKEKHQRASTLELWNYVFGKRSDRTVTEGRVRNADEVRHSSFYELMNFVADFRN